MTPHSVGGDDDMLAPTLPPDGDDDTLAATLPPDDDDDPLIGKVLDRRYRFVRPLGGGAMGVVYEAVQIAIDRPVAVKLVRDAYDVDAARRFRREARTLTRIAHPNIVTVYDFGTTDDGVMYLVMELLRGNTLAHELAAGAMPLQRACAIAIQLCEALAGAHEHGIVHRDLKPANVVVIDDRGHEVVKVLDFGIARRVFGHMTMTAGVASRDSIGEVTRTGIILGTPLYLSPEALAGDAVDPRMDLYALGCVLYELLTGAPPFSNAAVNVVLTQQLIADPPPLPREIPASLAALTMSLLAKSPDARPASASAVAAGLRAIAATLSDHLDDEDTTRAHHRLEIRAIGTCPPQVAHPPAATTQRVMLRMRFVVVLIVLAAIAFGLASIVLLR